MYRMRWLMRWDESFSMYIERPLMTLFTAFPSLEMTGTIRSRTLSLFPPER
jgi:hypothetical protein